MKPHSKGLCSRQCSVLPFRLLVLIASLGTIQALAPQTTCAGLAIFQDGASTPIIGGTYNGTADTMILINDAGGGGGNQNFGAREDFEAGETTTGANQNRRALMRFDVTALKDQYVSINSITLRLTVNYNDSSGSDAFQVYRLASANAGWVEGTGISYAGGDPPDNGMSTWNQRVQGSQNWAGSAGANTAGTDYLTPDIASTSFNASSPTSGSLFDLVFTDVSFFDDWANGNNPGLYLRTQNDLNGRLSFYSSEDSIQSRRPQLIVDYAPIPEPHIEGLLLVGAGLMSLARRRRQRSQGFGVH
ncbi:MAG: DNRLRE domain-containing protein [Verrucomicrobia bacterium]|nr:DNRLRE domain-containing protein [Verrucomicrobiota bacterium]